MAGFLDFFGNLFGSSQSEAPSDEGGVSFSFTDPEGAAEAAIDFSGLGQLGAVPDAGDGLSFLGDLIPSASDVGQTLLKPATLATILGSITAAQAGSRADDQLAINRAEQEARLASMLSKEEELAEKEKDRALSLELARISAGAAGAAAAERRRQTQLQALLAALDARRSAARGRPELLEQAAGRRVTAAQQTGELGSRGFSRLVQGIGGR